MALRLSRNDHRPAHFECQEFTRFVFDLFALICQFSLMPLATPSTNCLFQTLNFTNEILSADQLFLWLAHLTYL